jgi:hypothetical protein
LCSKADDGGGSAHGPMPSYTSVPLGISKIFAIVKTSIPDRNVEVLEHGALNVSAMTPWVSA